VTRDLISALTQQLCSPAAGLFRRVGGGGDGGGGGGGRLYPVPGECGAAQARRFKLLGQFMAKVGGCGWRPGVLERRTEGY
jgi:hypothetical protein